MKFELFWYESLPYIYGFAGWAALRRTDSWFWMICGVLLLVLAALVLRMRWKFRTLRSNIVHRTAWRRPRAPRKRRFA